jgi:hypothetical protein
LGGRTEQLLVREGTRDLYAIYTYHEDGSLRFMVEGTATPNSAQAFVTDSTKYEYDAARRLTRESKQTMSISPYQNLITYYDYDENGQLKGERWCSSKKNQWTSPWPLEKTDVKVDIRNEIDDQGRLVRREYYVADLLMAMDSLTYVADGRMLSLNSWDKLHPRHPQFKSLRLDGAGRAKELLVQYPIYRRKKRIGFLYNDYGLLMQYSYFDDKNRAVVMELHYDFYKK